jgi:hypothetical protein
VDACGAQELPSELTWEMSIRGKERKRKKRSIWVKQPSESQIEDIFVQPSEPQVIQKLIELFSFSFFLFFFFVCVCY